MIATRLTAVVVTVFALCMCKAISDGRYRLCAMRYMISLKHRPPHFDHRIFEYTCVLCVSTFVRASWRSLAPLYICSHCNSLNNVINVTFQIPMSTTMTKPYLGGIVVHPQSHRHSFVRSFICSHSHLQTRCYLPAHIAIATATVNARWCNFQTK